MPIKEYLRERTTDGIVKSTVTFLLRRFWPDLVQDLRYGARSLQKNPRFTLVSALALALAIGVNTAVFTFYKALIARPLDGRDPSTLVNVLVRAESGATVAQFSYPDFEAYREGMRSLSGVIAFSIHQLTLADAE